MTYYFYFSSSRCTAYRQFYCIHLLHSSLFSAILFIIPYDSTISSSRIPFCGLHLPLLPSILPSITYLNNPSNLNTRPIQFFFLFLITLINSRFSRIPYSEFPRSLSCPFKVFFPYYSTSASSLPPIF